MGQSRASSVSTDYLYDGDRLSAGYNSSGTVLRRYVHGPGTDEPLTWYEGSGTTDRRYLIADNQGTVIAEDGSSVTRYTYGPYGEPNAWTGSRFRYTGQIALPEVALYHYKARVYDPVLGRFLQTDPVGYQDDLNLYAYARNNAVDLTDHTGRAPNRAQVTDPSYVNSQLQHNSLATVSRNASGVHNTPRYFFTQRYGWVDLRHFAEAAHLVHENGVPAIVVKGLGVANEVGQTIDESLHELGGRHVYHSGFSPEDIPSNAAGATYGEVLNHHGTFADWARIVGALPASDPRSGASALPATDPSVPGGAGAGMSASSGGNSASAPFDSSASTSASTRSVQSCSQSSVSNQSASRC